VKRICSTVEGSLYSSGFSLSFIKLSISSFEAIEISSSISKEEVLDKLDKFGTSLLSEYAYSSMLLLPF
jgi:hypothetical protein